jgi:hypothetical protein
MPNTLTQQPGIAAGAFEQYAGKWVAVRDGDVIAVADSLEDLRANPDVTRKDAVFVVPEPSSSFF